MRRLLQLIRFLHVALAARTIQDYLFGGAPGQRQGESLEVYLAAAQKRIDRVRVIDRSNPSWKIEARKRLLQLATLAVGTMEYLDSVEATEVRQMTHQTNPFTGATWPSPWYPRA